MRPSLALCGKIYTNLVNDKKEIEKMKHTIRTSVVCLLLCCALLLPMSAAADGGQSVRVMGVEVSQGGYWLLDAQGYLSTQGADVDEHHVHYDAESHTLTLQNATLHSAYPYGTIYTDGSLTLHAIGTNNVKNTAPGGAGVRLQGDDTTHTLTLSGEADSTLRIDGSDDEGGHGIDTRGFNGFFNTINRVAIDSGTVTVHGGDAQNNAGNGIYAALAVYGGTLTVQGGKSTSGLSGDGVYSFVDIFDGQMHATGGDGSLPGAGIEGACRMHGGTLYATGGSSATHSGVVAITDEMALTGGQAFVQGGSSTAADPAADGAAALSDVVYVSGGHLHATGGDAAAGAPGEGIAIWPDKPCTIYSGTLTMTGGENAAGTYGAAASEWPDRRGLTNSLHFVYAGDSAASAEDVGSAYEANLQRYMQIHFIDSPHLSDDVEQVADAFRAVELAFYANVYHISYPDEAAVHAYVQNIARNAVGDDTIAVAVQGIYEAPIAGSSGAQNDYGKNGEYLFEITVSRGEEQRTTEQISLTIRPRSYVVVYPIGDIDENGSVDAADLSALAGSSRYNKAATEDTRHLDPNRDGKINFADLAWLRNCQQFGK